MKEQDRVVTWGGPIQSMLTGSIGLAALLFQWKQFKATENPRTVQWLILLLSLFWLRQSANFFMMLTGRIVNSHFSTRSDEALLALHYNLPVYSISAITAGIGLMVSGICFLAIPARQRTTFLLSGLVGGVGGYILWLKWIGPLVMP